MPMELFKEKILPFLDCAHTVNLQCLGEPLLYPHFFEMAQACTQKGCRVIFTTNGVLLKEHARRIAESRIDGLTLSLDAAGGLEAVRGIAIASIAEGLNALARLQRERKSILPRVEINFVALGDFIAQLPEVIEFAARHNVGAVTVIHAVIHSQELISQSLFQDTESARRYFRKAQETADNTGVALRLPPLDGGIRTCRQPFGTLYINANGDVRPCCMSTINEPGALKLGNLHAQSLSGLWNCAQMRLLRRRLLKNAKLPRFCEQCPARAGSLRTHIRILKGE